MLFSKPRFPPVGTLTIQTPLPRDSRPFAQY
jgi:hypothetical protein